MEKFEIQISTFEIVGGEHYYGRIDIPMTRQTAPHFEHTVELNRKRSGETLTTIRFDTIQQIIDAATTWFLESPLVKPGDRLVIWKGFHKERDTRIERPDWNKVGELYR